jgi:hypothetical protein
MQERLNRIWEQRAEIEKTMVSSLNFNP